MRPLPFLLSGALAFARDLGAVFPASLTAGSALPRLLLGWAATEFEAETIDFGSAILPATAATLLPPLTLITATLVPPFAVAIVTFPAAALATTVTFGVLLGGPATTTCVRTGGSGTVWL